MLSRMPSLEDLKDDDLSIRRKRRATDSGHNGVDCQLSTDLCWVPETLAKQQL